MQGPLALGMLDKLDKPLFDHKAYATTKDSGLKSPNCALEPNGSSSSTTESQSSDCDGKQTVVLNFACKTPEVVNVETCCASFIWQEPEYLKADAVGYPLPPGHLNKSVTYHIQVQQVHAPSNGAHDTSGQADWRCAYTGSAKYCKVEDLRPGRRYAVRVLAAVDVVQDDCDSQEREYSVHVEPSGPLHITTQPTAPAAPQPPSLAQRARNALKLKWNAPDEPGSEAAQLTYVLQVSPPPLGLEDQRAFMGFVEVYRGPEKSYKVNKLQAGVRYTVRVQAWNEIGEGPFSLCSAFSTQATVPTAPQPPMTAAATATSISLEWVAPADNGSPITSYVLERDDGHGGDYQLVYAGPSTEATVAGLRSGVTYRFRLRADNDEGKSLWSTPTEAHTGASTPSCPQVLQVVAVNRTSATVSWRVPEDDGGSKVVSYEVELQAKSKAATAHMGSDWLKIFAGEAQACTINSLRPGCTYRARVRVCNSAGWGPWTTPLDIVTAAGPPEVPLALTAASSTSDSLMMAWSAPRHDGGTKVTAYRLETTSAATPGAQGAATLAYSGGACSSEVPDLQPGQIYLFRVQAINAQGAGPFTEWLSASTSAAVPLTPDPPKVAAVTSSGLTLRWTAPPCQGAPILGYALEMACALCQQHSASNSSVGEVEDAAERQQQSSGNLDAPVSGHLSFHTVYRGPSEQCDVTNLLPHTQYVFRVCAANEVGSSAWSQRATALTAPAPPGAPEELCAQALGSDAIQLQWFPPLQDHGAPVNQYLVEQCRLHEPHSSKARVAPNWHPVYSGPATTCTAPGLGPGSAYQFRVRAANICGLGPHSAPTSARTAPAPPSAPGRPVVLQRAAQALKVRWEAPSQDHGAPVSAYVLEGAASRGVEAGEGEWQVLYSGRDTTAKVSGLQPATQYSLRVAAINAAGSSVRSNIESTTTMLLPPSPPTDVSVSELQLGEAASSSRLLLTWSAPAATATSASAISYEVAATPRPTDGYASAAVKVTVGRKTECRLEALLPGTSYSIRLRAVGADGTGHSAWSEEVTAATPSRPASEVDSIMTVDSAATGPMLHAPKRQSSTGGRKSGRKASGSLPAAAVAAAICEDGVLLGTHAPSPAPRKAAGDKGRVAAAVNTVAARKRPVNRSAIAVFISHPMVRTLAVLLLIVAAVVMLIGLSMAP